MLNNIVDGFVRGVSLRQMYDDNERRAENDKLDLEERKAKAEETRKEREARLKHEGLIAEERGQMGPPKSAAEMAAQGVPAAPAGPLPTAQPASGAALAAQGAQQAPAEQVAAQVAAPPVAPEVATTPAGGGAAAAAQGVAPAPPIAAMPPQGAPQAAQGAPPPVEVVASKQARTQDPRYPFQRRIELAEKEGNSKLAQKYRLEYAEAIRGETALEVEKFNAEITPQLNEIKRLATSGELERLPQEQRAKMLELVNTTREMQLKHAARGVMLARNPLTKQVGLDILSNSPLVFGAGTKITDLQVKDGQVRAIGADGNPLAGPDGKVMTWPTTSLDELQNEFFPQDSKYFEMKDGDGSRLVAVGKKGAREVYATPGAGAKGEKAGDLRGDIKEAKVIIANGLGITYDPMKDMLGPEKPELLPKIPKIIERAGELVRSQKVPFEKAARMALDEFNAAEKRAKDAKPGAKPAAGAGPVDWKSLGINVTAPKQ